MAICKLCMHKSLYSMDEENLHKVLKSHLISGEHINRFTKFEKDPWRFPFFVSSPLTYQQYKLLIDQSVTREGKKYFFHKIYF